MFETIGIGVAFSPNLQANIHEAARLAIAFNSKLVLIHVGDKTIEKEEVILKHLNPFLNDIRVYELIFREGHPVEVIVSIAEGSQIDLLVIGALQRENIIKFYLGSIARKISRQAKCSIMLLTHPTIDPMPVDHIVVNGLEEPQTQRTIESAFYIAKYLRSKKITIVEEISQDAVHVKINDDKSLRRSNIVRERLKIREDSRVKKLLAHVAEEYKTGLKIKTQAIFGKRGYSIGHYTEVVRADLLVMNAPTNTGLLHRLFPHDIEHILTELPSDVLIIR